MQTYTKLQSYRNIFSVAVPMILSAISIPMLGIVDTAILGHLDSPVYLAAINIGATVFNILFWGFGFLKMSTTGLIAQAYGERDNEKIRQQLSLSLMMAFFIAIVLVSLRNVIGEFSVNLASGGGLSAEYAMQYFQIRILSAPATLILYVLFGYFLAIQQTRKVLFLMLVNQVGNMLLDYIFVMKYNLGIKGVAYGSVYSEYTAFSIGIIYMFLSGYRFPLFSSFKKWIYTGARIKSFFSLNRDIFIRTLSLMTVFALMTKGSARLGGLTLAANAVLLNFFYLMSYGLDGFAHAVESLCGQAYGAKDNSTLKRILSHVFTISVIVAVVFSFIYIFFGEEIINLLTSIPEVREYAVGYIVWLIIVPIISVPSFVYDGLFVATTEAKIMRNSMVIATVFCYIPLWYFLRIFENHGLWIAFSGFFIVRTSAIHLYYRNWIKNWEARLLREDYKA